MTLDVYEFSDGNYFYMNKEYKLINVAEDGTLLGMIKMKKDDVNNKKYIYDYEGKELIVDYSLFFDAKIEYMKLEKKAKNDPTIDLTEAQFNMDNAKKVEVKLDGKELLPTKSVRNKTYIWGTDNLGRDMFIRVLNGGRISLIVGFVAAFVNFIIGVLYGGISGYMGGACWQYYDAYSRYNKCDSYIALCYTVNGYNGNGIRRIFNIADYLTGIRSLPKILNNEKFDAIIASSTYPFDNFFAHSLAKKWQAVHIYEVHDLWPLSPIELGGYSRYNPVIIATQYAEDKAYTNADAVVSLLPLAKEYMISRDF